MNRVRKEPWQRGPLAWMTYNRVTPNLLMIALLLGGFLVSGQIKKEVFPDFELDMVSISVAYPGASPEEVEQGIILVVEEVVRGIEGIPQGNLDQYVFPADDPKWDSIVPGTIPSKNRRTTVTCYSWPGVHPEACMLHYAQQLEPFMEVLFEKVNSLSA